MASSRLLKSGIQRSAENIPYILDSQLIGMAMMSMKASLSSNSVHAQIKDGVLMNYNIHKCISYNIDFFM